jgi:hypothetical protein
LDGTATIGGGGLLVTATGGDWASRAKAIQDDIREA